MEDSPVTENDCPNVYLAAATAMYDLNIPQEAFARVVACFHQLASGFPGQSVFIDMVHDHTETRIEVQRRLPWTEGNRGYKVEYNGNNVFVDIEAE